MREPMGPFFHAAQQVIRKQGHRLVAVVTSASPRTRRTDRYQGIVAQAPLAADVIVSNHPQRWAGMLAPYRPDLMLILGWSWKMPPELIALPRVGMINWHGALLPRYRGRGDCALQWMLRNDEPSGGVTYHWVDDDWDTGPILAQQAFPIMDDDDVTSIVASVVRTGIVLLPTALERATRGEPGTPQPAGGFYVGPFEPEWGTIDWNAPARTIHNQVHSWLGRGAPAMVDGVPTTIPKTRLVTGPHREARPGSVLARADGIFTIQCGNGPLAVLASHVDEHHS